MSGIESLTGLLRLVELSGGCVDTRIRIQKEAFLVAAVGAGAFDARDFTYHHYGPYNRGISDLLQVAVSSGLLKEKNESGEDQSYTKYSYHLTDHGRSFLSNRPNAATNFEKVVKVCHGKHWRTLELAATVKFLEQRNSMDRRSAIAEAIDLKPATQSYLKQALELLDSLPNPS